MQQVTRFNLTALTSPKDPLSEGGESNDHSNQNERVRLRGTTRHASLSCNSYDAVRSARHLRSNITTLRACMSSNGHETNSMIKEDGCHCYLAAWKVEHVGRGHFEYSDADARPGRPMLHAVALNLARLMLLA